MNKIIGILILIFLFPLIFLVCLLIFFDDGLPVIFRQKRIGFNQKEFVIYKLRTMKLNCPELPTDKLNNPEFHITSIGKLLRKLSFDEILNIVNVIKGDMNFIGYRPCLKSQKHLNYLRFKNGVYKTKPGITGLAQVNGRDFISNSKKIQYEIEYISKKSLELNIKILIKTFILVSNKKNISH